MFSVAMKGSSAIRFFRTVASCTTSPPATLCMRSSAPSRARNASGRDSRRFDESSSVRSSHCVAAVSYALPTRFITNRVRPQTRSHRIGLRL